MSFIATTDIHLTDNPDHAYRWRIFDFLKQRAKEHRRNGDVPKLIIAGDMTENKSGHSARLVNDFAQQIATASEYFAHIYLMRGNHDYKPGEGSFFHFLRWIRHVTWADDIYWASNFAPEQRSKSIVLAPHGVDFADVRRKCALENPNFLFCHATFNGAKAANGFALDGESLKELRGIKARIFSGDIHTRQKLGPVEYIGTPYPIDFDEDHSCRVIEISDTGKVTSVPTDIIRKHTLTCSNKKELHKRLSETRPGDQVKVRWHMSTADLSHASSLYTQIVDACSDAQVLLTGGVEYLFDEKTGPHVLAFHGEKGSREAQHTTAQIFDAFVKVRRLRGPLIKTGRKIVGGGK